jgi:hypothetical protein
VGSKKESCRPQNINESSLHSCCRFC